MITIDLQSGFNDEPVEIRIGDELVFQKEHVKTKKLLGFADTVTLEKFDRRDGVSIHVKVGDLAPHEIQISEFREGDFVGVSLEDGKVNHLIAEHPKGPAEKAGLKSGDIIVRFNGQAISNSNQRRNAVAALLIAIRETLWCDCGNNLR